MHDQADHQLRITKPSKIFHPGELGLAAGLSFLVMTVVLFHFVMGVFLAAIPAVMSGLLLTDALTRAQDKAARSDSKCSGLGFLLLGMIALVAAMFESASLSYEIGLHAQQTGSPLPSLGKWMLTMGSWPIPALLMLPALKLWTNWPPRRRHIWCFIILTVPLVTLVLHQFLALCGGPLNA